MNESARLAIRQLVCRTLNDAGWQGAEEAALGEIEDLVLHHLGDIVHYARELASVSRRTRPQARDFAAACDYYGASLEALEEQRRRGLGDEMAELQTEVEMPLERTVLVDVPPALDGGDWRTRSKTLDIAPDKYPKLPHEHLYLQTPVFQTISSEAKDTTQVRLDHRAAQSRLVEESLRNLVRATDAAAQPPARKPGLKLKMAGESVPIVNWELINAVEVASSAPLKRIVTAAAAPQPQKRARIIFSA